MSKLEDIHTSMWSDPDFEQLGRDASLLLIWSWTNTRCGMAGLYKVSRRAMTESKVALEDIDAALAELAAARMVFYDDNVLFVRARVKRLRQKTIQIAKAIVKDVSLIAPQHPLRVRFLDEYGGTPWLREALLTLTGPSGDPHGGVTSSNLSQIPGPSSEGLSTLKGTGKGKGKGKGNTDTHARWCDWAERNLPDIDPNAAAVAASIIAGTDQPVTAETVIARLRATRPEVVGGAVA